MIKDAEAKGLITPGKVWGIRFENTYSVLLTTAELKGFTSTARGYKLVIVMASSYSIVRRIVLKAFGAELYITDPAKGIDGVLQKVQEILDRTPNSHFLHQFENPANTNNLFINLL
ncbi:putative inactive cysteine synthase 2 [Solanum pennellii]|uniref:Inactive cysteine synthase 2 n=1 Tax=Solanum pennellii TaxID=28526 RepID=A0ABM1V1W5_SOLPN|nr:putative inactive cysteine synthase 2 [Solanum pennellii]